MSKLLCDSRIFLKKNASTILTSIGGIGVVTTAVLAVKATPKAKDILMAAEEEKGEELTTLEKVKFAGPSYIPTVLSGAATIACIFGANALNKKQQAALTSAYALLDNSYKEYKKKVKELYGEDADENVRDGIARDRYNETDISVDDNKKLFYDDFSGRYFESTMEDVIKAEYNLNKELTNHGGVYLNQFYEFLDIPPIESGKELGWSQGGLSDMYWSFWMEFNHRKVVLEDGLECCIIEFVYEPMIDFDYY